MGSLYGHVDSSALERFPAAATEKEGGSTKFRELSADEIDRLVTSINNDGCGVLHDYLPKQEIQVASRFVLAESAKHAGEYFFYNGSELVAGTLMAEIGASPVFRRLLAKVYERSVGESAPHGEVYQALRVVSGRSGLKKAWRFHYDSYVITALVPIIMPSELGRGDLVIYPRLRRMRRNAMVNVIERIMYQNRLVQYLMASKSIRHALKARTIEMEVGNVYFFRGYESLHANEPCSPDVLRATALFHFADPHEGCSIVRILKELRQRRRNSASRARPLSPSSHPGSPQGATATRGRA